MRLGGRKFAKRGCAPDARKLTSRFTNSHISIHETHRFYEIDVIGRLASAHVVLSLIRVV